MSSGVVVEEGEGCLYVKVFPPAMQLHGSCQPVDWMLGVDRDGKCVMLETCI